jgi:hypothetical protein
MSKALTTYTPASGVAKGKVLVLATATLFDTFFKEPANSAKLIKRSLAAFDKRDAALKKSGATSVLPLATPARIDHVFPRIYAVGKTDLLYRWGGDNCFRISRGAKFLTVTNGIQKKMLAIPDMQPKQVPAPQEAAKVVSTAVKTPAKRAKKAPSIIRTMPEVKKVTKKPAAKRATKASYSPILYAKD